MGRSQTTAKLENTYSQIPKSSCEDGCGRCCGPVFPSLAELRNIKDWCAQHHLEYRDFLAISKEGDCPYLSTEKECVIYPVRPFLCRLLGVSIDLPCPLGKCTSSKILNHAQSDALYEAIYLHGKEKTRTEKHRQIVKGVLATILQEMVGARHG